MVSFDSFDKALCQLGQSITENAHGAQSHLSQLAELQAKLDQLKIEAKTKTDRLKTDTAFQPTTED